jgi:hypothetical protein
MPSWVYDFMRVMHILFTISAIEIFAYTRAWQSKGLVSIFLVVLYPFIGACIWAGHWPFNIFNKVGVLCLAETTGFIEYTLALLFFYIHSTRPTFKRFLLGSVPVYLIAIITYDIFSFEEPFIGRFSWIVRLFVFSIWSAFLILEIIDNDQITSPITKVPAFWLCFALLVYHSGMIFSTAYNSFVGSGIYGSPPWEYIVINFPFPRPLGLNLSLQLVYYLLLLRSLLCFTPQKSFR